jgi:formate-dependent nitrite reductase cytochrome c552 subunit
LSNVPINVPVYLKVSAVDPKNSGTPVWTLTKPADSKAVITTVTTITTAMVAKFTPDVVGAYMVQVTLRNSAGVTSAPQFARFNAGTYIGVDKGNCKQCHPTKTAEWSKTAHATLFSRELDNQVDGPLGVKPSAAGYITHYSETCTRCHTTGWYPAPYNGSGGYWDAKEKAKWTFPTWKQIDEVFTKKAPSNWQAAPAEVKNMGTIGCEVCHGPANEHVTKGAKVMSVSLDAGVCDQCHGAAANHSKGWQLGNSKHQTGTSFEEINGEARAACMRCHGGEGFITFLANPKNQAAWSTEEGNVSCAVCHDPHSDANPFQLRVFGKPVEVASLPNPKDVGLSAICYTCHWTRRDIAADVATIKANGTPGYSHYSSAAELLSDTGGYTYDQTVPNSPHGALVGVAPIPNPAAANDPAAAKFLFSSPGDPKGNVPGPCVTCHMNAIIGGNDPNAYTVGGHSFNTVNPAGNFDYGASCKPCHGEVKDFNMKAKADYDGNGKVEGVQDEIKGLLNAVWKSLEAKGWKQSTSSPYATPPANADAKQKAAFYNFRTLYGVMWSADASGKISGGNEGKAAAIHNFKRSCALLQLSLKDLNGTLPAGAADCTK